MTTSMTLRKQKHVLFLVLTAIMTVILGITYLYINVYTKPFYKLKQVMLLVNGIQTKRSSQEQSGRVPWAVGSEKTPLTTLVTTPLEDLPLCPEVPENPDRAVNVSRHLEELKNNGSFLRTVSPGGTYKPTECVSRERLAIIVPYRDREEHRKMFLAYMHPFLQKQKVHYTIFIAEMTQGTIFNTGLLQNVGFALADTTDNFTCFIIHDVDLLPVNEMNVYRCAENPKHYCHINTKYSTKV